MCPDTIRDGVGKGYLAKVNQENQLVVKSVSESVQKHRSGRFGDAFQVIGEFGSLNNSTHTVLHIKNISTERQIYVTYMRVELIGCAGGNFNANTRFEIGTGRSVASGGTVAEPVCVNLGKNPTAGAVCTTNNPTMTGTFTPIDKWYPPSNGQMMTFNKEGALVLSNQDELEIRCVTDHTSGLAYVRASFLFDTETD